MQVRESHTVSSESVRALTSLTDPAFVFPVQNVFIEDWVVTCLLLSWWQMRQLMSKSMPVSSRDWVLL